MSKPPYIPGPIILKITVAIAWAEGYYVQGSRPQRNNNPGDLERDLTGKGVGWDGPYVKYATPEDGMDALEYLVRLMFSGSHIYTPDMTIAQVASHYTANDQAIWAKNVATVLHVTVDTKLNEITA